MTKKAKQYNLLSEYTHYQGPSTTGFYLLFTIDACEKCSEPLCGANAVRVRIDGGDRALRAAGLVPKKPPAEGGWSELHRCVTCSECCYEDIDLERAS